MSVNRSIVGLVVAGVLASGCAGFTPSISPDETPKPGDAFLYGRFAIRTVVNHSTKWSLDGHLSIGFSIKCLGGETYVIRFSEETSSRLQVIRIAPSSCSLEEILYTDLDGNVKSRKPAPKGMMHNVTFGPGKAYYLGDFFATASRFISYNKTDFRWEIASMQDEYASTSAEMKAAFPKLSGFPTENRMVGR